MAKSWWSWMLLDVAGCYWMLMMSSVGYWMLLVLTWDVSFLDMFGTLDVRPHLKPDSGKCSWVVWHEPRLLRAKIWINFAEKPTLPSCATHGGAVAAIKTVSADQNCSAGCKTPHVGQIPKRNPLNPDMLNLRPSYSERYESQFVIGSLYLYIYIYINVVHVSCIYIYIFVSEQ